MKKMGAFFSYGDVRLGQGRENSKEFLRNNADLTLEIENKLRAQAEAARAPLVPVAAGVMDAEDEDEDEL